MIAGPQASVNVLLPEGSAACETLTACPLSAACTTPIISDRIRTEHARLHVSLR
jgi:hypothetical protein